MACDRVAHVYEATSSGALADATIQAAGVRHVHFVKWIKGASAGVVGEVDIEDADGNVRYTVRIPATANTSDHINFIPPLEFRKGLQLDATSVTIVTVQVGYC